MAATTSKDFGLRFFYFAFACPLYSIWRLVDLLVQIDLFEEYDRSPVVTANDVLTLSEEAHWCWLISSLQSCLSLAERQDYRERCSAPSEHSLFQK